jgi:hypothetical protein
MPPSAAAPTPPSTPAPAPPSPEPHLLHGRSQEIYDALQTAGIIHPGDHVRRVIIDISVDAAVVCYIERYQDSRVLELLPVLGRAAEIRWARAGEPE